MLSVHVQKTCQRNQTQASKSNDEFSFAVANNKRRASVFIIEELLL